MSGQPDLSTLARAAASATPGRAVLCEAERVVSCAELDRRVAARAAGLTAVGVGRGDFVGVYARPCVELITTLLALTELGAVFVPLDLAYPLERLLFMAEDAKLSLLLMHSANPALAQRVTCPVLEASALPATNGAGPSREVCELGPRDTSYVIYTSGTTGDPKGVLVHVAGAMNTITETTKVMDFQPGHRLLQLCPIGFDVFILELGLVLAGGGTLVFDDDVGTRFDERLRQLDIQHILCTPTSVAEFDLRGTPLHTVMFGGETLPEAVVERYRESFRIVHAYGVTETAICATLEVCERRGPVAMGEPLPNTSLELVDEQLCPVGPGEVGEVVLGGVGVSNGYLDRPELDARRFVADPARPGQRRFRTGDLARRDADGQLYFLGRNDRQIKYREYRLELFEVESLLLRHPRVRQAAVLVADDQLYAFVCPAEPTLELDDLRAHLGQHMPAVLLPEFELLDRLPLTAHKKTDYAALERGRA